MHHTRDREQNIRHLRNSGLSHFSPAHQQGLSGNLGPLHEQWPVRRLVVTQSLWEAAGSKYTAPGQSLQLGCATLPQPDQMSCRWVSINLTGALPGRAYVTVESGNRPGLSRKRAIT